VQGCRIAAAAGPFNKVAAPRELLHNAAANPAAPHVVGKGGLANYVPINELAPRTLYVLDLSVPK